MASTVSVAPCSLVSFKTSDGLTLQGMLMSPKNAAKGGTCLIYVHGMTGNFYSSTIFYALSKDLSAHGIASFAINTRGHDILCGIKTEGMSHGGLHGTAVEGFEGCIEDIGAAVTAIKKLGYKEIILCGHSTGCQKIVHYMHNSKDMAVSRLVLISPADDFAITKRKYGSSLETKIRMARKLIRSGGGNNPSPAFEGYSPKRFLSIAERSSPEASIFDYSGSMKEYSSIKAPMLVILGGSEEWMYHKVSYYKEILEERSGSEEMLFAEIKNANHSFDGRLAELSSSIISYLIQHTGRSKKRGISNRARSVPGYS
jgi:pimeloyl-ACP methyl ester carboxylesterase